MGRTPAKIALSVSRDIPFDKLVLSQANVRHVKCGVAIEEFAQDIARRSLLQSLTVRAMVDDAGAETGLYEIPAGGRRYRALELLVRQKRLSRTAPVPCVIRTEGLAEEDSLAENVQRAPLHPLDQFRAFMALREKGRSEEEIAAAFFVSVGVVRQRQRLRLRLAAVSPRLLDVYAEDGLTLDQLMAFTVSADHERQEQVFERLTGAYSKDAYTIRRMLTEGAVRAADKRVRFIGLDAYEEAGGAILRDLFQGDDGGWLHDAGLVDRLVAEKLEREASVIRTEGWRWLEVAPDFPYGHTFGLRQLRGEPVEISPDEDARRSELQAEYDRLEAEQAEADELPEEVDRRLGELETQLVAFENQPLRFEPDDLARAGAFVSLDANGGLRVERGYVRPEDEAPLDVSETADTTEPVGDQEGAVVGGADAGAGDTLSASGFEDEEDGLRPISDRMLAELTAHRTVALRDAVALRPDIARAAALHALCLQLFYLYGLDSCLEIVGKSAVIATQAPGLNDSPCARAITERHAAWSERLPQMPEDLWDAIQALDPQEHDALFAHCVGMTVNAAYESWNRRPRAMAHADRLAQAVDLDMAAAGWTATGESYFGRVTKARAIQSIEEARGSAAAEPLRGLKKDELVEAASELIAGSGWLPEALRTPGRSWHAHDETEERFDDGADPFGGAEPPIAIAAE